MILFARWEKHTRGYRKLVYLSLEVGMLFVTEEFSVLDFFPGIY